MFWRNAHSPSVRCWRLCLSVSGSMIEGTRANVLKLALPRVFAIPAIQRFTECGARMLRTFCRHRLNLRWSVPVIWFTLLLPAASAGAAIPPARKNVLVITEVGITHRAAASITEAAGIVLLGESGISGGVLQGEPRHAGFCRMKPRNKKWRSSCVEEYQGRKIDVIVAMGPRPIKFTSRFANSFFPGVPVIFGGSTQAQAGNPKLESRFTGSWMKLEPEKTLDAILKLLPKTRHIVVVGGSSAFDKGIEAQVAAALSSHPCDG